MFIVDRFAFLATVPVVLIYWSAYFIILTKGGSSQSTDEHGHLYRQPHKYHSISSDGMLQ